MASSTVQPPFASMRTLPMSARVAATRATSSSRVCPGSATLTFAVPAPGYRCSNASTSSAGMAGTVALTGTVSRTAAGGPTQAASMPARSHEAASGSSYSTNGPNSPQPAGPAKTIVSRVVRPRNLVRIGRRTATAEARTSSTSGSAQSGCLPRIVRPPSPHTDHPASLEQPSKFVPSAIFSPPCQSTRDSTPVSARQSR